MKKAGCDPFQSVPDEFRTTAQKGCRIIVFQKDMD